MAAAAPLSKPQTPKKAAKRSATAPQPSSNNSMQNHRNIKRPRPSDHSDLESPANVIRKKEGMMTAVGGSASASGSGSGGGGGNALSALQQEVKPSLRKGMYLAFIDDAFAQRKKGVNDRYQELLSQFRSFIPAPSSSSSRPIASSSSSSSSSSTAPTLTQLRIWLDALTHVVSKLDQSHSPLVEMILSIPWATMDDQFVSAYVRFIGALVSARTEWLRSVLEKCVKGFKYRSNYTGRSSIAMPSVTRRILYGRLHTLLRMLISLIPTLSSTLSPLLVLHFPSKREPRFAQICYIDNLLAVTQYCPSLVEDILSLIIERALNIDVEIQGEQEEWDEDEEALAEAEKLAQVGVKDIVDRPTAEDEEEDSSDDDEEEEGEGLDLDNIDSDDEPNPVSDDEAERRRKGGKAMSTAMIRKVLETRGKLDAILKVIFDHLAAAHSSDPSSTLPSNEIPPFPSTSTSTSISTSNPISTSTETTPTPESAPTPEILERRRTLFRALLDIFDRTLLRTFKTRNTQFLLFYLCSLDPSSSDHFIGVLLGRALFETDAPDVTRVAAAGYVASFVSRAKFVDAGMTRKVVGHLCGFLRGQLEESEREREGERKGTTHLPVFYAVAQAVFYIFCFRWKDLLDEREGEEEEILLVEEEGRRWMSGLEVVKKAVESGFNPLKVCAQSVVNQFATIAHQTSFLYCFSILDSNRRLHLSAPSTTTTTSSSPRSIPLRTLSSDSIPPPPQSHPQSQNRLLHVAEEMDSFFPFDPFKLPLSSIYITSIYRDWDGGDDESSSVSSDTSENSDDSDDSDSDSDDDDNEGEGDGDGDGESGKGRRKGLAVPGMSGRMGMGMGEMGREEEDEVARSFEAMSLSPDRNAFGGRREDGNGGKGRARGEGTFGSMETLVV